MRIFALILVAGLSGSAAHVVALEKTSLGVEIGQHAQLMMRQDNPNKKEAPNADLIEIDSSKRPHYRGPAEATEAFARPSKIDDSLLANWTPRMPAFIEQSPWFYAGSFVGAALVFLGGVCFYVQYEDAKDEERREFRRNLTRRAVASGALQQRMGVSFAPRAMPQPSAAALQAAAEAVVVRASRAPKVHEPVVPAPKAKAVRAMAAAEAAAEAGAEKAMEVAENSMHALTNAVGNLTGVLSGEVPISKLPKFGSSLGSTDGSASTISGASTPQSQLSSQHSSKGSGRSNQWGIRSGTLLAARVPEVIFASPTSWQEIGELTAGQQVVAAGPPEMVDGYTMVPIRPRGAVDVKILEAVREY